MDFNSVVYGIYRPIQDCLILFGLNILNVNHRLNLY